jgi:hypothetical protein
MSDHSRANASAPIGQNPEHCSVQADQNHHPEGLVRVSRIAFILPSFLMVLALSAAYVRFGGLAWMQAMFYGIGAAVIGIIARSAFKPNLSF